MNVEMNKLLLNILVILLTSFVICEALQRNILWNQYKDKTKSLDDLKEWRNHTKQEVYNNMNKIPENIKKEIIKIADEANVAKWPSFLAMDFLEFHINGNRDHFEGKAKDRKIQLDRLVIGELLTQKGKYINQIANGVWLTLEESTWVWPAHLTVQKAGDGLPDPTEFIIDLGAGEETAHLAWVKLLLGENLSKINHMIPTRIDYEINRRILRPYLDRNFTQWMGLDGKRVNNWNIWINTNVLMTSLLAVDNTTLREQVIAKTVKSADGWLNGYGDDGGCDEGPSYWGAAGGKLIEYLSLMTSASGNQFDFSKDPLMKSIGDYIYKLHINENRFVNFADASAKGVADWASVLKYGLLFNDENMKGFASYIFHKYETDHDLVSSVSSGDLKRYIARLSVRELVKPIPPKAPLLAESWLPDIQVITLRSTQGSPNGLFLGAKAGTNHESHNHNDIGNFVLYVNGMPAIIDVGVGVYTKQTFSKDRYKLWYMQSQWHNTPTINGVQQHDGEYTAKHVKYNKTANGGEFEADISGAYPKEANVKSWVRKFIFDRKVNEVHVKETYELSKFVEPFKVHFMTSLNETHSNGAIVLKDTNITLHMNYDQKLFDVKIDEQKIVDKHLLDSWGNHVNRVTLVSTQKDVLKGEFTTIFKL